MHLHGSMPCTQSDILTVVLYRNECHPMEEAGCQLGDQSTHVMAIHNVRNSPLHDVMTGQGENVIVAIDHDKLLNCWNNELFLDNISACFFCK